MSQRKAETKTVATRNKRSSDCASGYGRSEVPNLKPVRDGIDSLRIGLAAEELWEGGCTKKITNARFDVENIVPTKESQVWRQRTFTNLGQFRSELATYIRWFNNDRIRLKLKGLSPVDYQVQRLANIAPTSN